MVDYKEIEIDRIFNALSDSTRRKMLLDLSQGTKSVSELGKSFKVSKQSISKHLKVLENAGLIHKKKDGRIQRCQLEIEKLSIVQGVLDEYRKFWNQQFDALEDYIENVKNKEKR